MFSFTRQERQVILFLLTISLIGITTSFLVKKFYPSRTVASFNEEIGKINLNSADKELLMSVSGIGEKLAQRIIEYRKIKGRFSEIEELKNIKGITNYRFDKAKEYFAIRE